MHHVALQTRDWEASLRLYREVLGMSVAPSSARPNVKVVLLDMGDGSHMELFQPTEKTPRWAKQRHTIRSRMWPWPHATLGRRSSTLGRPGIK